MLPKKSNKINLYMCFLPCNKCCFSNHQRNIDELKKTNRAKQNFFNLNTAKSLRPDFEHRF